MATQIDPCIELLALNNHQHQQQQEHYQEYFQRIACDLGGCACPPTNNHHLATSLDSWTLSLETFHVSSTPQHDDIYGLCINVCMVYHMSRIIQQYL